MQSALCLDSRCHSGGCVRSLCGLRRADGAPTQPHGPAAPWPLPPLQTESRQLLSAEAASAVDLSKIFGVTPRDILTLRRRVLLCAALLRWFGLPWRDWGRRGLPATAALTLTLPACAPGRSLPCSGYSAEPEGPQGGEEDEE